MHVRYVGCSQGSPLSPWTCVISTNEASPVGILTGYGPTTLTTELQQYLRTMTTDLQTAPRSLKITQLTEDRHAATWRIRVQTAAESLDLCVANLAASVLVTVLHLSNKC